MREVLHNTLASIYTTIHQLRTGETYHLCCDGLCATFENQSPWMQDRLGHQQRKECPVVIDAYHRLCPSDVFWDIGAAYGLYSCLLGSAIPEIKVVPFEPHPDHASLIRSNLATNNVDGSVHNIALGSGSGTITYHPDTEQTVNSEFHTGEKVRLRSGDELIADNDAPIPDVVKVDVEGAELDVLTGLEETISDSVRLIYCETHPDKALTRNPTERIRERLVERSYDVQIVDTGEGEEPLLRGMKH